MGLMGRSLDHIRVTVRCSGRKSISLHGLPCHDFPLSELRQAFATAGNVENKHKEQSQYAFPKQSRSRSLDKSRFGEILGFFLCLQLLTRPAAF